MLQNAAISFHTNLIFFQTLARLHFLNICGKILFSRKKEWIYLQAKSEKCVNDIVIFYAILILIKSFLCAEANGNIVQHLLDWHT